MDLTIDDVSDLLELPINVLKEWASQGILPAYRLGEEFRFSRVEIEDWLLKKNQSSVACKGVSHFCLFRALNQGEVLGVIPGKSKREVLKNASCRIAQDLGVDPEILTEMLLDRESLMSTGIGSGIALPHTRELLSKSAIDRLFVAYPESVLEYGSLDGKPVHTLFFIFASYDKRHLQILAKLSHLSQSSQALTFFQTGPDKPALLSFISEWEDSLVCVS
ncbi:MAG: system protein [Chlamydiota bacterium]|jgi:PTS system nitrogen regulatory IIA component